MIGSVAPYEGEVESLDDDLVHFSVASKTKMVFLRETEVGQERLLIVDNASTECDSKS